MEWDRKRKKEGKKVEAGAKRKNRWEGMKRGRGGEGKTFRRGRRNIWKKVVTLQKLMKMR